MKVDRTTAENDLQRFIELLKIKDKKLEKLEEEKEEILSGIEYGNITIDDDGVITYKLDDPVLFDDGDDALTEVTFSKRRVSVGEMEKKMIGKTDMEKSRKLIAFLVGKNSALFEKVMGDDYAAITNIAAFFLPR